MLVAIAAATAHVSASDAVRQLSIRTSLAAATSLQVSSHVLVFDVPGGGTGAVTSLDYVASARTQHGGEVILCVERPGGDGALDPPAALTLEDTDAPVSDAPVVAQRWVGSGTRSGRLTFRLRTATSGRYVVPVRVLLSAP